ncbi:MAG: UTRA domain-containing protein [Lachnospiraceae bacterium]|nr:UTRA domain-containing protein [Lachnospiraceae bacterium]
MPKSRYEEIFQDLKDKIESRQYEYETLLPSEHELTQIYDCSRNTLRRAISKLTGIGYTQPMHGRGVRVIYTPQKQQDFGVSSLEGLCQAATEHGFSVLNQVITFTDMVIDAQLAKKTSFEENTEVYFIQRLRSIDGVPKMIDNTLLRKDLVPGLTEEILKGSLFQYIETKVGMPIRTVKRRVTIERTTPFDEKYLTLDGYNCLAVITSHVFNADGIQFEYTESRNRPDLFAFNTVVSRNV